MTVVSVVKIAFLCWKRILEAQHTGEGGEISNVTTSSNYVISESGRPKWSEIMPYFSIQYHRQVPAPGPIFSVAGHRTCQDLA